MCYDIKKGDKMNQNNNFGNMHDPKPMPKVTDKSYSQGGGNIPIPQEQENVVNNDTAINNYNQQIPRPGMNMVNLVKPENPQTQIGQTNQTLGFTNGKNGGFNALEINNIQTNDVNSNPQFTTFDVNNNQQEQVPTTNQTVSPLPVNIQSNQVNNQIPVMPQFQSVQPQMPYREEFTSSIIGDGAQVVLPQELPPQEPNFAYPIDEKNNKKNKKIILIIVTIVILLAIIISGILVTKSLLTDNKNHTIEHLTCSISEEDSEIKANIEKNNTYTFTDSLGSKQEQSTTYIFDDIESFNSYRNSYSDDLIYDVDGIFSENYFDSSELSHHIAVNYDYDKMKKDSKNTSKNNKIINIVTEGKKVKINISSLEEVKQEQEDLGYTCEKA